MRRGTTYWKVLAFTVFHMVACIVCFGIGRSTGSELAQVVLAILAFPLMYGLRIWGDQWRQVFGWDPIALHLFLNSLIWGLAITFAVNAFRQWRRGQVPRWDQTGPA